MTGLMKKGVQLTHYYTQPSCTPSRVTMMTGKWIYKNGFQNYELQHSDPLGVPLSNKLFPAYMRDLGYRTVMHGKWNIGHCNTAYLPHERGFDHFIGYLCPGHGYSDHTCGMDSGVFDMLQGSATLDKKTGEYTYEWSTGAEYAGTYDTELYRNEALATFRKHAAMYDDPNSVPLFMWSAQHGMHGEMDSGAAPPDALLSEENKAYLKILKHRMMGAHDDDGDDDGDGDGDDGDGDDDAAVKAAQAGEAAKGGSSTSTSSTGGGDDDDDDDDEPTMALDDDGGTTASRRKLSAAAQTTKFKPPSERVRPERPAGTAKATTASAAKEEEGGASVGSLVQRLVEHEESDSEDHQFFKMRLLTAAVLMAVDNSLRDMVESLEELGMLSNAIIFFNSDNGGDTVWSKGHPGNNFPLRSEKFAYYEGGVRVPAFVFSPSYIKAERAGSTYHGLMHHVDLMTTFYGRGGGDVAALLAADQDIDGVDQWAALMGEVDSARDELVLNLPRSKEWTLGEEKTDEGIALRMGKYKLLFNHVEDGWFEPAPGNKESSDAEEDMMADACCYNFYSLDEFSSDCTFSNQLFDVEADPHETTNLWSAPSHKEIKAKLIARAEELVRDQPNDYGAIVPKFYERNQAGDYATASKLHGEYVVPFGCTAIA